MIVADALLIAVVVALALTFGRFARSDALQCVLALAVASKREVGGRPQRAGFVAVGLACLVGAPAEG